jgi:hypothetical protein
MNRLLAIFLGLVLLAAGSAGFGYDNAGNCGYYRNRYGHVVPRPCGNWHSEAPPRGATALCRDGTFSYSQHPYSGGTCSHHGGVAQHL